MRPKREHHKYSIIAERPCACGCGHIVKVMTKNPKQKYFSHQCVVRAKTVNHGPEAEKKRQRKLDARKAADDALGPAEPEFKPWVPKERPILMTDEAQFNIDLHWAKELGARSSVPLTTEMARRMGACV